MSIINELYQWELLEYYWNVERSFYNNLDIQCATMRFKYILERL